MLTASHLSFNYGSGGTGISDINLEIAPGELVAVLGMNGSGKTTLGRALGGLLFVAPGAILLDGQPVAPEELRQRAVYLFSPVEKQFIGSTVEEDILFGLECRDFEPEQIADRLQQVIADFDLQPLRKRSWQQLSEGEKQRAALAAVLALDPAYLLLDEPTAALDNRTAHWLYQQINRLKQQGKGILVLTNQLMEAARADQILMLRNGKITAVGSPDELITDENKLTTLTAEVARTLTQYGFKPGKECWYAEGLVEAIAAYLPGSNL